MQDTNQFTPNYSGNQPTPANYQSQYYSSQTGNSTPNPQQYNGFGSPTTPPQPQMYQQPQQPYNQQAYPQYAQQNYRYVPQQPMTQMDIEDKKSQTRTLGILSIIFGIFIPLVGLILGIVTNSKEKELRNMNIEVNKLGVIGMIVSGSVWLLNMIIMIIMYCFS